MTTDNKIPDVIYALKDNSYPYRSEGTWSTSSDAKEMYVTPKKYHADHVVTALEAELSELKALCEGMAGALKEGETILPLLIGDLIYMANRMNEGARFKEMTATAQFILDRMEKSLTAYETHKNKGGE